MKSSFSTTAKPVAGFYVIFLHLRKICVCGSVPYGYVVHFKHADVNCVKALDSFKEGTFIFKTKEVKMLPIDSSWLASKRISVGVLKLGVSSVFPFLSSISGLLTHAI